MQQLTYIVQEALAITLMVSGPPVLLSLMVGLFIAVFQATTQIQEQTLTFAPKVIVIFGVLALLGPWIGGTLMRFTFRLYDRFPALIGH